MKTTDKQAIERWEKYRQNLIRETSIDRTETPGDKAKRVKKLERNIEEWFKYYFACEYRSEPCKFHVAASRRITDPAKKHWYEVRAWARSLSKSTRTMMEFSFMALTGRVHNVLLISNSYNNAERLLMPYMINFESNQRIINDYGTQQQLGSWESGEFTTRIGCSFRAVGANQSPRGTKDILSRRVDGIIFDDIDTDEECRNEGRITEKWRWIEKAVIPTVDLSSPYIILFCGNIIAKYCCITEAIKKADHVDVINIRDLNGMSTWPSKNSEEDIDYMMSKMSYSAAQQEFFNNPVREGTVFKEVTWGDVPALNRFKFVVAYGDPSPSNKENKDNSYKALPLVGYLDGKYYIITAFLEQASNAKFINWYYDIHDMVGDKTIMYCYIENNSLQDPFYEQVLKPLNDTVSASRGKMLFISPDMRKKPDKFCRIEGNMEPLNRCGKLIFNKQQKDNPHMQRLEEQFKSIDPGLSAHADGPDAVEAAIWVTNKKTAAMTPPIVIPRQRNIKRY